MTRINVVPVSELTDQHLMAEYRELPMVIGSSKRSNVANYVPSTKYTLNTGHVKFFYGKKSYLIKRYNELIVELKSRGFNIDPHSRNVDFSLLDRFPQSEWEPNDDDRAINRERIQIRIMEKPNWYRHSGKLS